MSRPVGFHPGPRVPAQPLFEWLAREPRRLPENEMRILNRCRHTGHVDYFIADRIFCLCGHPEMLTLLYGDVEVAA